MGKKNWLSVASTLGFIFAMIFVLREHDALLDSEARIGDLGRAIEKLNVERTSAIAENETLKREQDHDLRVVHNECSNIRSELDRALEARRSAERLQSHVLKKVKSHEADQLTADAAWFKGGCEEAIDSIIKNLDEEQSTLKLQFMLVKDNCRETSISLLEQLQKEYSARPTETVSDAN
jgi:site-specific recombinase